MTTSTIRTVDSLVDVPKYKRYLPFLQWFKIVDKKTIVYDMFAGITVGLLLIPQSMSYAKMANVPIQFGLYASFFSCISYLFLGTSPESSVGPTAVVTLVLAELSKDCEGEECIAIVTAATLISGLVQLLAGIFQLGIFVTFISHAVISGFCSAASLTIITQQSANILIAKYKPQGILFKDIYYLIADIRSYNLPFNPNFLLGISTILFLIFVKKLGKFGSKYPILRIFVLCRNIVAVVISLLISYLYIHLKNITSPDDYLFKVIGYIPAGLPTPYVSSGWSLHLFSQILVSSILLSVVGFMEAHSISSSFPYSGKGTRVDPSQELIAIGTSNITSSFFRGIACTTSFARSAVNASIFVQTQLCNFFSLLVIGISILFFTEVLYYIPLSCLAAIISVGVANVFDLDTIKSYFAMGLKIAKYDAVVTLLTFLAVISLGLDEGLILGIISHSLIMLYRQSRPTIMSEVISPEKFSKPSPSNPTGQQKSLRILKITVTGNLYYISAQRLVTAVENISRISALDPGTIDHKISSIDPNNFQQGFENDIVSDFVVERLNKRNIAGQPNIGTLDDLATNPDYTIHDQGEEYNEQALGRYNSSSRAAYAKGNTISGSDASILSTMDVSTTFLQYLLHASQDGQEILEEIAKQENDSTAQHVLLQQDTLSSIENENIGKKVPFVGIILDLSMVSSIDSSGLHSLETCCKHLLKHPIVLSNRNAPFIITSIYFVGLTPKIYRILKESQTLEVIQLGFSKYTNTSKCVQNIEKAVSLIEKDAIYFEEKLRNALQSSLGTVSFSDISVSFDTSTSLNSIQSNNGSNMDYSTPLLNSDVPSLSSDLSRQEDEHVVPMNIKKPTIQEILHSIHTNTGIWSRNT